MSPFDASLVQRSDYFHTATNLEKIVYGNTANGFRPSVRGDAPEDGAAVSVAYYDADYLARAQAARRATELLRYVKAERTAKAAG